MNRSTTRMLQRRRKVRELHEHGLTPREIAARLDAPRRTVYRDLHALGVPVMPYVANVSQLPRPPFWELHSNAGNETVLGRKFCSGCGRWRLLCDYPPESRASRLARGFGFEARCTACRARSLRYYRQHATLEQVELRREYERIYKEAQRRRAGLPQRLQRRPLPPVERVTLPVEPLLAELARYDDGELTILATRAGISARALYRYRYGESQAVRIDVADKLAVAMGTTSSLIWGDQW